MRIKIDRQNTAALKVEQRTDGIACTICAVKDGLLADELYHVVLDDAGARAIADEIYRLTSARQK